MRSTNKVFSWKIALRNSMLFPLLAAIGLLLTILMTLAALFLG